jgi:hypothetical protein
MYKIPDIEMAAIGPMIDEINKLKKEKLKEQMIGEKME